MSLEMEFAEYKALHKYVILKAKITQYYKDLEDGQVNIPDFMRIGERPEDKADRDIREMIANKDLVTFDILYQQAYEDLAEVLD